MSDELFSIKEIMLEMRGDIKTLMKENIQTEERLKAGSKHFETIDDKVEAVGKRLVVVEAKRCPAVPSSKITYWLICGGFTLLGLIITLTR